MYRQSFDKLFVTSLTQEQHERTCGYWFTVTNGSVAHTAFATRAELDRWMAERGLALENELADAGTWSTTRILYGYHAISHGEFLSDDPRDGMGPGEFYSLRPVLLTMAQSNARYTLAQVTESAGVRTVHTLNPNVRDRPEFDRAAAADWLAR
jgi:hypothetical protein